MQRWTRRFARMTVASRTAAWLLLSVAAAGTIAVPVRAKGPDLDEVLGAVGERVRAYYQRAQSLVATESVRLRPYDNVTGERRLTYELRLTWEAATSPGEVPLADVVRRLVAINGRPPRPKDPPGCMDPQPASPEPLSMLLPEHRAENIFKLSGSGKLDGHAVAILDYKGAVRGPAEVVWKDDCVSVNLPGRTEGRIWIDVATSDVLRLDEHLLGQFEVPVPPKVHAQVRTLVLERADSSTRYKPVAFRDPDESLVLPSSIDTLTIFRGSGIPMMRMEQKFSDYKRFIGESHLVTEP